MTDSFQNICWEIALGFRDAVMGSFKIFHLDKEEETKVTEPVEQKTILAQRRELKQKKVHHEEKKSSEPKVMHRIIQCCAWNGGVFWLSILIFNYLLLPMLKGMTTLLTGSETGPVWSWMGPMLTWTFSALWILPLFVLSKIVNCFWFADIADCAYRKSRGRPQLPNISMFIADMLFSLLLQTFFLLQGTLASFLPLPTVSQLISVLHMSLLYSLYSFEYKWVNMGWELHQRLDHIEKGWPYYFGFGLPMAVLTALPTSLVVSGCVFSILFPVFIISANEALTLHPNHYPLKLFAPCVALTNAIFHHSIMKRQPVAQASPKKHARIQEPSRHR